jgi:hypothetical protein
MKLLSAIAVALFMFAAIPVHADSSPPKGSIKMGDTSCDVEIDCDRISSESSKIVQAAQECVNNNISDGLRMSGMSGSGEFENCVMPNGPYTASTGTTVWSACCVKRLGDTCGMSCSSYIKVKQ